MIGPGFASALAANITGGAIYERFKSNQEIVLIVVVSLLVVSLWLRKGSR